MYVGSINLELHKKEKNIFWTVSMNLNNNPFK